MTTMLTSALEALALATYQTQKELGYSDYSAVNRAVITVARHMQASESAVRVAVVSAIRAFNRPVPLTLV